MKVLPFKIPKPEQDALVFQKDEGSIFYDQLHQHKEIQMSHIISGSGTLIVGDTIHQFRDGDVFVIGSDVPHVLKSDAIPKKRSKMLTLFFTEDSFGSDFFKLEELSELTAVFDRSSQGFKIDSERNNMARLFLQLETASKLERFIILLQLLKFASKSSYQSLSSFVNTKKFRADEGRRLRRIFEYTMKHFTSPISLETISNEAAMTKSAFCKYFKKRTNKTYVSFLNELRVEHACKQLIKKRDMAIGEIAYQSGFSNVSHFNRQFKSIKGQTPKEYRMDNERL